MKEIKIYQKSNKIYNPRPSGQGHGHAMVHRPVGTNISVCCVEFKMETYHLHCLF